MVSGQVAAPRIELANEDLVRSHIHAVWLARGGLHLEPSLTEVLELGEQNGALAGIISGSGPTVAFLTADLDSALELQIALSAARLTVVRATGPVHGARVVGD